MASAKILMDLKILQIFHRYLQYGGEEGSVTRIGDALDGIADVGYFISSSDQYVSNNYITKLKSAFSSIHNASLIKKLKAQQRIGKYDIWQIHNVFPFMSPSVYAEAFRLGVPVIQYLHNYRMSCVNGYFLNDGKDCKSCIRGNFLKAGMTACWRDSHLESAFGGVILKRMQMMETFQKVSGWIALSKKQKENHVMMGIPEEKIHIIPHFYEYSPEKTIETIGKNVLFIGRLSKEKGVHLLLDGWKLVNQSDAMLVFMGDGPELKVLQARVKDEGIPNVRFLGFVKKEDQMDVWRESAFSVVPSIWDDPLPTVVFESWERGRAVIGSAKGGNIETIDHGVNGLKFSENSAVELAEAIGNLLGNPQLCSQMAASGIKKIKSTYHVKDWESKMSALYREVL
jgi:glycosyltransferase involved in cell wall biosynthesis